jgi:hypothetical protein
MQDRIDDDGDLGKNMRRISRKIRRVIKKFNLTGKAYD